MKEVLTELREVLAKQRFWLEHSHRLCRELDEPADRIERYDRYENLCSRYARSVDFLVRKVYRAIDAAEFESQGTLLDVVHRAHKRGLFDSLEPISKIPICGNGSQSVRSQGERRRA
ncbi:hypothetical protein [Hydrogenimonas sp.]